MAKLSSSMNRKLRPVFAAGHVRIGAVIKQEIHASPVAFLGGNQQRRRQISCLRVHSGT